MEDQGLEPFQIDVGRDQTNRKIRSLEKASIMCGIILMVLFFMFATLIAPVVDCHQRIDKLEKKVAHLDSVATFNSLLLLDENHSNIYRGLNKWDILKLAIIEVESTNNPMAHNMKSNALGCMQITPIYVEHINNKLGYRKYKHKDALSTMKSLAMFEDMNRFENPNKDIDKAIRIHNPNGGQEYVDKVKLKIREIVKRDLIYIKMLN